MESLICLDTDFCINFLRQKKTEVAWFEEHVNSTFAISYITVFELLKGSLSRNSKVQQATKQFVNSISMLPTQKAELELAAHMSHFLESKGQSIDYRDILIAACASQHGYALKTNNIKHFSRIPNLHVV